MSNQQPAPIVDRLPEPGEVLAGRYRVERVVGVGGMGIVSAALHVELDERVAVKLMKRSSMNPQSIARFLREARAAAKIKSEHVARVTDVGMLESGTPYMVMELLDGEDLSHLVRTRGPLPVPDAVDYVLQACEAVAEAHAMGVVHRDLKPENLFLARKPGGQRVVKVVDFGISKQLSRDGEASVDDGAKTRTSAWLGSPLYMSPEQMRSAKDVDARTDLWSMGLILFELLTGKVAFNAPSLVELWGMVMTAPPPPLEASLPDAPPGLGAAIIRCLQKDRDARYANVAELAMDLEPFAPPSAKGRVEHIVSIVRAAGQMRAPGSGPVASAPVAVAASAPAAASAPVVAAAPLAVTTASVGRAAAERGAKAGGRGVLWLLLVLVLLAVGGAYLGYRARAWPFHAAAPCFQTDADGRQQPVPCR
jgi:serine/threonine-protein kinase